MLDNIVQGIRYFVQFCLAFKRHNYVLVTSCSSFIKNAKLVYLPFDPEYWVVSQFFVSSNFVLFAC